MRFGAVTGFACLLASALPIEPAVRAQEPERVVRSVWDGVYSSGQADRGQLLYESNCSPCHGINLSGNGAAGEARPLAGEVFLGKWRGGSLQGVFSTMKMMPPGFPSGLSDDTYVAILSYVLRANGFPEGAENLDIGALEDVRFEEGAGPEPPPSSGLVQVVGCLERGQGGTWFLKEASEPVRASDPSASVEAELGAIRTRALGAETFQLINPFPRPDAYEGHRVEVKGLLIKITDEARINVISLQSLLDSGCER